MHGACILQQHVCQNYINFVGTVVVRQGQNSKPDVYLKHQSQMSVVKSLERINLPLSNATRSRVLLWRFLERQPKTFADGPPFVLH